MHQEAYAALPRSCPAIRPARNLRFAAVGRSAMPSRIGSKFRRSAPIAILTAARLGQPIHRSSFVPLTASKLPEGSSRGAIDSIFITDPATGNQMGVQIPKTRGGMRFHRSGGMSPSLLQMLDRGADCGPDGIVQTLAQALLRRLSLALAGWFRSYSLCRAPSGEKPESCCQRRAAAGAGLLGTEDAKRRFAGTSLTRSRIAGFLGEENLVEFYFPESSPDNLSSRSRMRFNLLRTKERL